MIKVIDAMPGTGKTLKMIEFINNNTQNKYLYITPYLKETHRISGVKYTTKRNGDVVPVINKHTNKLDYNKHDAKYNCVDSQFKHPMHNWKGKSNSLLKLIRQNHNVVGTHSLYKLITQDVYNELKSRGYILIIDETLDILEKFDGNMKKEQIETMWDTGLIYREPDTCKVRWRDKDKHLKPERALVPIFKRLADNGNLISPEANNPNNIIFWMYPIEFLDSFNDIYILTHRFESSLMCKYLKNNNKKYTVEYLPAKHNMLDLLDICDNDRMNAIGDGYYSLSLSNIKDMCDTSKSDLVLKNNLVNWFININRGSKIIDRSYTTFKKFHGKLKGKGYSKCFLPCNTRATDDYKHKTVLAYCCNRFLDRNTRQFIDLSQEEEEQWAISECIQWIYRHGIRQDLECKLYIPSQRMRNLLLKTAL